ncbi:MAG: UPF0149 family protein [Casimicrobiaceae bacterium]
MKPLDGDKPLSDQDIVTLGELLATIPEDNHPLDVSMLDGYLVGVLLQPEMVLPSAWLSPIFSDVEGQSAFPDLDTAQQATGLIMRRYNELNACILTAEPVDPIVFELEDDAGQALAGKKGIAALEPWAIGFMVALEEFPSLANASARDDELASALIGIMRHLPPPPESDSPGRADYVAQRAQVDQDAPLLDLDDAIDELATCVLEAAAITRPNRPQTRASPKVGRNDPCPCGSGRKFKTCHGQQLH